jgi:hypothetical protein
VARGPLAVVLLLLVLAGIGAVPRGLDGRRAAAAAAAPAPTPPARALEGTPVGRWRTLGRRSRWGLARAWLAGPGRPSAVRLTTELLSARADTVARAGALSADARVVALLGLAAGLVEPDDFLAAREAHLRSGDLEGVTRVGARDRIGPPDAVVRRPGRELWYVDTGPVEYRLLLTRGRVRRVDDLGRSPGARPRRR